MVLIVIGVLPGHNGRIGHHDHTHFIGQTPLSKAGSKALRWAAVEAAQQAWRETNPWHQLYRDVARRHAKTNPAKAAVARKVLIAAWHVLAREQPFKSCAPRGGADPVPASSHFHLAA